MDTIQLTNPELRRNPDDKRAAAWSLAHRELSVTRTRRLDGELREQVTVVNYSAGAEDLELDLGLGVDMADIFEVRGYPRARPRHAAPGRDRRQPGRVRLRGPRRRRAHHDGRLRRRDARTGCRSRGLAGGERAGLLAGAAGIQRAGELRLDRVDGATPERRNGAARRGGAPSATAPSDARAAGPGSGAPVPTGSPVPPPLEDQLLETPRIDSDHEILDRTLRRSLADLAMLRNHGPAEGESYLAAGVPWFATLFGRDSLIAALELVAFYPRVAADTLTVLARLQATTDDPWHDAEPGKILHELRTGEMAGAGETPHDAYYGSVDSTPLWLILLGEVHAWTGDDELLERLWPNALAALDWIDRYGDLDGDGFVEYRRRSRLGLLNQGWKDSGDAIRHTDGRPAEAPIALAEVQGYVYAAKRAMARLARHRGDAELADAGSTRPPTGCATSSTRRSGSRTAGFYAMALDGAKRPVASIGSNAGQALWTGIVPAARAARVADRLLAPDLFSGWGIRTYAAGQPGYNPVGYHTGSIWPHDNALIAAGLKCGRLGRRREPDRRPPDRGRPVVPGPAPPGAVLRLRARRGRRPGRLSGRLLAAGMGRGHAVLPAPDDARPAGRRHRPPARARSGRRCPSG